MILEVDAGNTRIKWRLLKAGLTLKSHAVSSLKELAASVEACELTAIRIASVRGQEFDMGLAALCLREWGVEPEFARVLSQAGGVRNTYDDPCVLGIDRWLAVLAAYQRSQSACLVIDCGSAVTVELIDSSGVYLGGYIAPGVGLMLDALCRKTHAVKPLFTGLQEGVSPGRNTENAVNAGLLLMLLGLIRAALAQLESVAAGGLDVYCTGGDVDLLLPHLNLGDEVRVIRAPELVLDGLRVSCS